VRVALLDGGQDACDITHGRHRRMEKVASPQYNGRQPRPE
jgi:hypothetical protein